MKTGPDKNDFENQERISDILQVAQSRGAVSFFRDFDQFQKLKTEDLEKLIAEKTEKNPKAAIDFMKTSLGFRYRELVCQHLPAAVIFEQPELMDGMLQAMKRMIVIQKTRENMVAARAFREKRPTDPLSAYITTSLKTIEQTMKTTAREDLKKMFKETIDIAPEELTMEKVAPAAGLKGAK